MTREVTVTVDETDTVQAVEATGSRWRFQRIRPMIKHPLRKLTEEQEQEICALYMDRPGLSVDKIGKMFGINGGHVSEIAVAYGIPGRRPRPRKTTKWHGIERPTEATIMGIAMKAAGYSPAPSDPRPVWRVTVVRTVVEEIRAENLLDIAAYYDGTDARITKAELA